MGITIKQAERMKTIKYIAASLAIIAAASCQKDQTPEQTQEQTVTITANISNPDSKTALGTDDNTNKRKVLWLKNESFSLFDQDGQNHRFTTYGADNATSASFKHNPGDGYAALADFTTSDKYYAIYPSIKNITMSDGVIKAQLSAEQTAVKDNIKDDFLLMLGESDETEYTENDETYINMSFKHVTTLIKFELTEQVYGIRLIVKNSEKNDTKIVGDVTISTTNNTLTAGSSQAKLVNKTDSGYEYLEPGTYYIAIIPPTEEVYFRFDVATSLDNNSPKYTKIAEGKNTNLRSIEPGVILNIGKFSATGRVTE